MPNGNLAMLIGNGLSIAFSESLLLGNISAELTDRLTAIYGHQSNAVAKAMQRVAAHTKTGDPVNDFESLIGAFGGQTDILRDLSTFADLTEDTPEMTDMINRVGEFVGAVQRKGIGHTLEIIIEHTVSDLDSRKPISDLFRLVRSAFLSAITVANLNYDTVVLSVLSEDYQSHFCDMAHGGALTDPDSSLTGGIHNLWDLRPYAADFPKQDWKPIRLLHLHGSVTFWKIQSRYVKVEVSITRNKSVWQNYRDGNLQAEPLIVLANQHDKADHVRRYPFNLAYEVAEDDFRTSNHWLIVGYSFRDICVNELLKRCWDSFYVKPKILVVTKGDNPTDSDIETALGLEKGKLSDYDISIERDGITDLATAPGWTAFAS
ncbi:SIR2 family protein [Mycobacteroides abscessus]|uniref:SIR2 family protein n=1 Tax=Mycobacteroides abscessus TaxID=36809 RepID=UPI00092C06B7|nr:SIR2 family protein [Mycobacteroides abscessus]MDO2972226.1 SIR2 family protein [Mycobacteroides abscessus subsp. bolletii]MDO3076548.1 SIR2 family protein [Mycobacteroides abscessus subsp. bolletii]SHZ93637.1 Uncharacterised protein [Mycobacteroides abscessus subsp. bolletii]SIA19773.1 Uncharacterised protein [Mycobacteroides abscessus subsp. bolletii]